MVFGAFYLHELSSGILNQKNLQLVKLKGKSFMILFSSAFDSSK